MVSFAASESFADAAIERDVIFSLLAYSIVYEDWQSASFEQARGYNIGAVLVSPEDEVLSHGLNANASTGNGTQHAEVRAIQSYLQASRSYFADGSTVYTTLEPCAMCAGMMIMTKVSRTVFGQHDSAFGESLQRMSMDTTELPRLLPHHFDEGYPPYPRETASHASPSAIRHKLDSAYAAALEADERLLITIWLRSPETKRMYEQAHRALADFQPHFERNREILARAQAYLKKLTDLPERDE